MTQLLLSKLEPIKIECVENGPYNLFHLEKKGDIKLPLLAYKKKGKKKKGKRKECFEHSCATKVMIITSFRLQQLKSPKLREREPGHFLWL